MGLGISTVETIAKYVEKCGVKSILQTKPVQVCENSFKGLKLESLEKDVFQVSNKFFSKMTEQEKYILPEFLHNTKQGKKVAEISEKIRYKQNEHMYYINESGDVITGFKMNTLCEDVPKKVTEQVIAAVKKGEKICLLHNHPIENVLSAADLTQFNALGVDSIIATLPSGGFSAIKRMGDINKLSKEDNCFHNAFINSFMNNSGVCLWKLQMEGLGDVQKLEKLSHYQSHELKSFAEYNKSLKYKVEQKTGYNVAPKMADLPVVQAKEECLKQGISEEDFELLKKEINGISFEHFYIDFDTLKGLVKSLLM